MKINKQINNLAKTNRKLHIMNAARLVYIKNITIIKQKIMDMGTNNKVVDMHIYP
jgi:hypothetical protein